MVCWRGSAGKRDIRRLDKLVKKASSVVGFQLEALISVVVKRTLNRLTAIMDNDSTTWKNMFRGRLLLLAWSTDSFRRSFTRVG